MEYQVKRIKSKAEIGQCALFCVDHFMWDRVMEPKTYGRMGYIEGKGFYVEMTCEEENPKRTFTDYMDMVCKDSAMEVFLAFPEEGEVLTNDVMYINFEINSNAALYAKCGKGRKDRLKMPESYLEIADCKAVVEEKQWSVSFTIPEAFLKKECGIKDLGHFYCNFYKIAESPEVLHFASYSPIENETPNFHLPVFFAKGKLV
ncbi:MAG: carbohydrate-binding family 9-like protein [Lachnospiraceae bacterium]|nr:carbohydrate-binding family 9-like protein [Lachnospiraceae bacterium]